MRDDAAAFHAEPRRCRRGRPRSPPPSKTAQFPAMPKCTCTQTSSASPLAEPREEVLADGLDGAEGLVVDGRGASVKRPFGDVQANFLPTRRRRWLAATRWTEWPSTILICVLSGVGRQAAARPRAARAMLRRRSCDDARGVRTNSERCAVFGDCSRDDESTSPRRARAIGGEE